MSGSKQAKRSPRAGQGWEVAADEFYQENYQTPDADWEALQKDPKHLATFLPSKQTRNNATTRRLRPQDTRRRTSTRSAREISTSSAAAVGAHAPPVDSTQVAMMPDLSENLSNEQLIWEEVMQIKAMPIPMREKRELKAKLQNKTHLRLQGLEQFRWQRRKFWQHLEQRLGEVYSKLELWKTSLKRIEGNFGTGVVAYFMFIKWLMFLNLLLTGIVLLLVLAPTLLLFPEGRQRTCNSTAAVCCADEYMSARPRDSLFLLDLVEGTGLMERTPLFYGVYPSEVFSWQFNDFWVYYNLPLAYVCMTVCVFATSLVAIVKSAARGFREKIVENEGQVYQYCNLVFGGWDFCTHNDKSAAIKHKALYNEIKSSIAVERIEEERKGRTRRERAQLLFVRLMIWLVVVLTLGLAAGLIYFAIKYSLDQLEAEDAIIGSNSSNVWTGDLRILVLKFLPSLCIVALNLFIPTWFRYLIRFERYNPVYMVRVGLMRTIFLRLSSLGVLLASLYGLVSCGSSKPSLKDSPEDGSSCKPAGCDDNNPDCWETYVGQQIYRLLITDFATQILVTFAFNFPRALLARRFVGSRLARLVGEQEFDLTKHVLDTVYLQTLTWLGVFYAPLLPAIAVAVCWCAFYVKRFACLCNCRPPGVVHLASRSNSMFTSILLVSLALCIVPVAYSLAELVPSLSCGPFARRPTAWSELVLATAQLPPWLAAFFSYMSTAGFAVPALICLSLCLYYFAAVSAANKKMVLVLKNQLVLEGHDKQFLLDRLSAFIRQQQEHQHQQQQQQQRRRQARLAATTSSS